VLQDCKKGRRTQDEPGRLIQDPEHQSVRNWDLRNSIEIADLFLILFLGNISPNQFLDLGWILLLNLIC
jgi:hypothetical protein